MYIKDGQLPEDLRNNMNSDSIDNISGTNEPTADDSAFENCSEEEQPKEYTAEEWYEKYPKPDIMDRFKVHLIDSAAVYVIFSIIYYFFIPNTIFTLGNFIFLYLFFVYTNIAQFFTWIVLFITNGYTLGKYLYKHRVFRMDGEKLTLKDTIVRNLLIKGFCDAASCGIMNIASIIAAYAKPYSRAAHDIAAQTITVDVREYKTKIEKKVEFK